MTAYTATKHLINYIFGSPDRERLAGAIAETWIDLDDQIRRNDTGQLTQPWTRSAFQFLLQAESCLAIWDIQQGWISVLSAQRALLSNPTDTGNIERTAISLRREADKITGWRAKAIEDLLAAPKDEPQGRSTLDAARLISAVALRDDQFHTTYFKIMLRRRQLFQLFLVLWISVMACFLLSYRGLLPDPLDDPRQVAVVILFGVLGAGVSVAQGLLAADLLSKIPSQQIGAFLVWMRPAIGAVAALVALVLLNANKIFHVFSWETPDPSVIIAILRLIEVSVEIP
jgi:hypothetical protein